MAYPHVVAAITDEELANALRVNFESEKVAAEVHRLHWFAMEVVGRVAPGAPVVIVNEAIIRLAGYLFDQPGATRGVAYANALRNSGAAAILHSYRVHRVGST